MLPFIRWIFLLSFISILKESQAIGTNEISGNGKWWFRQSFQAAF